MLCSGIEFCHDPLGKTNSDLEIFAFLRRNMTYSKTRNRKISTKEWIKEWLQTFLYVFVFYIACTTVFVEGYQIPSQSMYPTFNGNPKIWIGDRIFALKWISWFFPFQRGDIIIFISVEDQKTFIVKRLVGLPGDTIYIKNNQVYINDKPLTEPPFANITYYRAQGGIRAIKTPYSEQPLPAPVPGYGSFFPGEIKYWQQNDRHSDPWTRQMQQYAKPYTVPKDCYFVMGDNSASSNDSRYWGFLPKRNVLGKATMIWWPLPRSKVLNNQ